MIERINRLVSEMESIKAGSLEEVEQLRLKYLSKKGLVSLLFDDFKGVPPEMKREVGLLLNDLKNKAQQ